MCNTSAVCIPVHLPYFRFCGNACLRSHQVATQPTVKVTFTVIIRGVITWYVPPAGVIELAAEVLAEPRQVWLSVWHPVHVQRVEQHLGIGGAAGALDLLQEKSTFCVVSGENLETTHTKKSE